MTGLDCLREIPLSNLRLVDSWRGQNVKKGTLLYLMVRETVASASPNSRPPEFANHPAIGLRCDLKTELLDPSDAVLILAGKHYGMLTTEDLPAVIVSDLVEIVAANLKLVLYRPDQRTQLPGVPRASLEAGGVPPGALFWHNAGYYLRFSRLGHSSEGFICVAHKDKSLVGENKTALLGDKMLVAEKVEIRKKA